MNFEVTILGSSSATPIFQRHPTAQVLNIRERFFLVDCGEGTQAQFLKYKVRLSKITHIFISHLHGDHYLGLVGLLSTMHLQGRTNEIHVYGQAELMDVIELQLRLSMTRLRYQIIFHPIKHFAPAIILEDEDMIVKTIILNHRIPCTGFLFKEKPKPRKLLVNKLQQYNIPFSFYGKLKDGFDYRDVDGNVIANDELTISSRAPRSYAFCSDTVYDESIINEIRGVDLLYHEATFLHDMVERAQTTFHTTSLQAATIAKKAEVKKLIIGHFSARYKELHPLLDEARTVFPNTELAIEGNRFEVE
ncbi:MAG TPA: ribonuclease Z [Bacteroidia bacterium]|nr:MAG: beta-lactamase domain-containing protein [Bacteroidetes bacterium OLB10]MBE7509802.1 ribonuclease Z [Bacteroidia bacterium]MBX3106236.1 ribonuclease Z [Bacteroidota bacterium]MCB0848311.1 ribonuclease Z [Bacteroidota bacterium]MCB8930726.1 ribonuclease Z [Bacteroidia bacterium]